MIVTCPICNTPQPAISHNLSDREIINMRKLGIHEHLCKTCYNEKLSTLASSLKSELIPLHEQLEIAKLAYSQVYEAWKIKAALYQAADYNFNLIKFEEEKKNKPAKSKAPSIDSKTKIEKKVTQILASLSQEQQESILKLFQASQKLGTVPIQDEL